MHPWPAHPRSAHVPHEHWRFRTSPTGSTLHPQECVLRSLPGSCTQPQAFGTGILWGLDPWHVPLPHTPLVPAFLNLSCMIFPLFISNLLTDQYSF